MRKNIIVYGERGDVWDKATELLSDVIYKYTGELPACVSCGEFANEGTSRCIYIGTKKNNKYINELSDKALSHKEEYYISVSDEYIIIEGSDAGGVLYGCADFYNKYIIRAENTDTYINSMDNYFVNPFEDKLESFTLSSYPSCERRGLWTWGHCIYDYRGYIDNMTLLKLNTLIIWNDFPPQNAEEIVAYAHKSNIKIFWGFPWLWDTKCSQINISSLDGHIDDILNYYEKNYAHLSGDGIYFQSFTELNDEYIDGILVAQAVTDFVNKVSERILEKYPTLHLQFGLHATSVREKLDYIREVNPQVEILWEDCGAFPFHYEPANLKDFDKSAELACEIADLRGEQEKFGVVLKGFTCLDWGKFEHQKGKLCIGVASPKTLENQTEKSHRTWRYVQACWLRNGGKAYEMIKLMTEKRRGDLCITALVEDGMFDRIAYFPVALYAEMLWDNNSELGDMMRDVALRDYVEFV